MERLNKVRIENIKIMTKIIIEAKSKRASEHYSIIIS